MVEQIHHFLKPNKKTPKSEHIRYRVTAKDVGSPD